MKRAYAYMLLCVLYSHVSIVSSLPHPSSFLLPPIQTGTFLDPLSKVCTPCPHGTFSHPTPQTGGTVTVTCKACPAGTTTPPTASLPHTATSSKHCNRCAKGSHPAPNPCVSTLDQTACEGITTADSVYDGGGRQCTFTASVASRNATCTAPSSTSSSASANRNANASLACGNAGVQRPGNESHCRQTRRGTGAGGEAIYWGCVYTEAVVGVASSSCVSKSHETAAFCTACPSSKTTLDGTTAAGALQCSEDTEAVKAAMATAEGELNPFQCPNGHRLDTDMARILNASFYNGSSSGDAAAARVLPSSVDVLPLSFWGTLLNVTVTSAAVPGDGRWGRKEVEARRREAYRFKDMMIKACVRCVEGTWTSPIAPNACVNITTIVHDTSSGVHGVNGNGGASGGASEAVKGVNVTTRGPRTMEVWKGDDVVIQCDISSSLLNRTSTTTTSNGNGNDDDGYAYIVGTMGGALKTRASTSSSSSSLSRNSKEEMGITVNWFKKTRNGLQSLSCVPSTVAEGAALGRKSLSQL